MTIQQEQNIPRIYVACLSAYNKGKLYGTWIDCNQDAEDIQAEIEEMLKGSPELDAEEWAIHDYENWQGFDISEYADVEELAQWAELLEEHGGAIAEYYNYFGTVEDFEDYFLGVYESEEDYVEQFLEDTGSLKQWEDAGLNRSYIDFEAIARDWFISDLFSVKAGYQQVYVFSNY